MIPIVSVVVLTYNQEGTISQTLDSIISQSVNFSIEIIIGEDASPSDNTRAICERYASVYPSIVRLLPKAPNKGMLRNYRDALIECRGKYIAVCSGDDFWNGTDSLSRRVQFLEENPSYGVVHTDYHVLYVDGGNLLEDFNKTKNIEAVTGGVECFDLLLKRNLIGALTVVMRHDVFKSCVDIDLFIEQGFLMEDYPTWLEMSRHTKIKYLDFSSATYRIAAGSISNNQNDYSKQKAFCMSVANVKLYYFNKYGGHRGVLNSINKSLYRELIHYSYNSGLMSEYRYYKLRLVWCKIKSIFQL